MDANVANLSIWRRVAEKLAHMLRNLILCKGLGLLRPSRLIAWSKNMTARVQTAVVVRSC
jgi:hypothetical protein